MPALEKNTSLDALIARYNLRPHAEGGWYAETYRSAGTIAQSALPPGFNGPRAYSTAIMYLLGPSDKSALHRIRQDEVWHFYLGGPLELAQISPRGEPARVRLGQDLAAGQAVQCVVPAGSWFGARPMPGADFCLAGCTVAPGFEFADFEAADPGALTAEFPHLAGVIAEFT